MCVNQGLAYKDTTFIHNFNFIFKVGGGGGGGVGGYTVSV